MALKETLQYLDLIDIFRALHPTTADYTFFSHIHATFSRINHVRPKKMSQ